MKKYEQNKTNDNKKECTNKETLKKKKSSEIKTISDDEIDW